jgi:hypothetical protein
LAPVRYHRYRMSLRRRTEIRGLTSLFYTQHKNVILSAAERSSVEWMQFLKFYGRNVEIGLAVPTLTSRGILLKLPSVYHHI